MSDLNKIQCAFQYLSKYKAFRVIVFIMSYLFSPLSLLCAFKDLETSIVDFVRQGGEVFVEIFRIPKNIYHEIRRLIASYLNSEEIKVYMRDGIEDLDQWYIDRERQRNIDYFDDSGHDYLMECPKCKSVLFLRADEPSSKCHDCIPIETDEDGFVTNTDEQIDMIVIRKK
ncbi:hypothetical protein KAR91_50305 [Candidatus Pacearchaeota archaeon]|nr:hypothetical protein [Candidatus Pacearchaeota archaeon]